MTEDLIKKLKDVKIVNTIHNTSNIPENVLEDANKLTYF